MALATGISGYFGAFFSCVVKYGYPSIIEPSIFFWENNVRAMLIPISRHSDSVSW